MNIMTSYAATLLKNTVYTSNIYFCRINDIIIGISKGRAWNTSLVEGEAGNGFKEMF